MKWQIRRKDMDKSKRMFQSHIDMVYLTPLYF